jgi:hypothetical protein
MKSIVRAALAVAVVAAFSMAAPSEAEAQTTFNGSYNTGYNAGLGFFNASRFAQFGQQLPNRRIRHRGGFFSPFGFGFGGGLQERAEDLPYFAKFPPVYYSGKVKRPYGISPYAAPPGIVPVEMNTPVPVARKVTNPYFNDEMEEVQEVEKITVGAELNNKTTWKANPYLGMNASK